jgi:hypothetical protein
MIYSMYFEMVKRKRELIPDWWAKNRYSFPEHKEISKQAGKILNFAAMTAKVVRESVDDSFVFIITNGQMFEFNTWLSEHGLTEYEVFRQARPITNAIHRDTGRNLTLVVLASDQHVWRDMFESEFETEEGEL